MPKCYNCIDRGIIFYEAMGEKCSAPCDKCDAHLNNEIISRRKEIKKLQEELNNLINKRNLLK